MQRRYIIWIGCVALVLIGAVVTVTLLRQPGGPMGGSAAGAPLVDQTVLGRLPVKDASTADTSHLDASIVPPTNSWLSGMVLQKVPQPVYPMPLSFLARDNGFELGLPSVATSPTVIAGEHAPGVTASLDQARTFTLTRYDKVSATLTYHDNHNAVLGRLTLAEGSPYVFYEAASDARLTLSGIDTATATQDGDRYLRYVKNRHTYAVVVPGHGTIAVSGDTATVSLPKDAEVTFYALPDGASDPLRQYAGNVLTGVETKYTVNTTDVDTSLTYKTTDGKPTIIASPGYQAVQNEGKTLATYPNIYGPMSAVVGDTLTTTAPRVTASDRLDVSHLTSEHKQSLIDSLQRDAVKTSILPTDSYYAGKQLARLANLLDIASQLGQTEVARTLATTLKTELTKRLGGDYFYYDSKLHGVAAQTKAFGSEDFNDHHFHYGYFIYAASVLGRYDAQFLGDYQKQVNLLVADIASYDASTAFPVRRTYDPYTGHSWAAGLAPFADGNNQESSSEAMNAWNAVELWGQLTHNTRLADTGAWMLANEALSAKKVWRTKPANSQYMSPLTSLNFGGKRTYATFFSDESNAKLAIQLIPMNPSMTSLAADGDVINQQLGAAIKDGNYNVPLGDYSLMYLALRDPARAIALSSSQKDTFIDDGNSRTYLDAWLYSQNDR